MEQLVVITIPMILSMTGIPQGLTAFLSNRVGLLIVEFTKGREMYKTTKFSKKFICVKIGKTIFLKFII